MSAHNISGDLCKDYTTWNTKSNPDPNPNPQTNALFRYLLLLLEIFTFHIIHTLFPFNFRRTLIAAFGAENRASVDTTTTF